MRIRSFESWNKLNEERALRTLPTDEEYWKRKGKTGKDVALYTHDDMDGIFCAIEMKKWLEGRGFKIVFRGDETIDQLSESYADVAEGEKLALFNSAGYLEIAINKGNAAGLFGLKGYSERSRQGQLAYQTVRVYFQ